MDIKKLTRAEQALMFMYIKDVGELPPWCKDTAQALAVMLQITYDEAKAALQELVENGWAEEIVDGDS